MSGSAGVARVQGDGTACIGAGYLTSGTNRQGGWDGPVVSLLPYLIAGHSYNVTVAARFNSATLPTSERTIGLTTVIACSETEIFYTPLQKTKTISNWVRLQSAAPIKFPPSVCADPKMMSVYVETEDSDMGLAIDVDDFRLFDMAEPSVGAGGAAGAGGMASAGNAGAAGRGGSG